MGLTLVELFGGTGALSWRLLRNGRPLTGYAGAKGQLGAALQLHLEIDGMPEVCVLNDAGPWGTVWEHLPDHLGEAADTVSAWWWATQAESPSRIDPEDLFQRLASAPCPEDPAAYVSTFLALQALNFRHKAIGDVDGRWTNASYSKTFGLGRPAADNFGAVPPQLHRLATKLCAAQNLDRIRGRRGCALEVEPIPGSLLYLDPPYAGTTGYGPHDLTRDQVLEIAGRWRDAGCRVAISEAEPIPGWRAIRLGDQGASQGLSGAGTGRVEWLSLSWRHPQVQMPWADRPLADEGGPDASS